MKKNEKLKALVVCSGGLDSTVALYDCVNMFNEVEAVTFDYGSNHNRMEHSALSKTCRKLGIKLTTVKLSFMKKYFKSSLLDGASKIPDGHYADANMKSTVVPFRNGIMLSIAAGLAESNGFDVIVLGNHSGDHTIYPDCRPEFIEAMDNAIKHGTFPGIRIYSPFCNVDKSAIVKIGHELGVDFSNTYSCYKGGKLHCGTCGTCVERIESFKNAGVVDPTKYENIEKNSKKH